MMFSRTTLFGNSARACFLTSCATAALVMGPQAHAADAANVAADAGASTPEIIVTAQRRNQNVQDVPMTLQALSGEMLSQFNATTFDDLLKYLSLIHI